MREIRRSKNFCLFEGMATGNVTLYQLGQNAPVVASFKVTAKPSRAGVSHLVKLVDVGSGQPVLSVFVRSGESADLKVPLGSYKINIATGEQWYGETKLFGKKNGCHAGHDTGGFLYRTEFNYGPYVDAG